MSTREERRDAASGRPRQASPSPEPAPTGWHRLFRRPRVLAEVRFAFGAALVMAAAGTVIAFWMPPFRLMPSEAPAVRTFVQAAVGFGLGWWGGLFWSTALVFYARRHRPLPPVAALTPATWLAGVLVAAGTLAMRRLGASVIVSIGVGVVVATVAARLVVGRAARRAMP
ncbi:MAG TPA: hypothetical protein VMT19_07030 [Thermoanaerobaculaceae bacterium]|nr:hypothetical protein [Thermoanaerobaculaceae bacterium]